METIPPELIRFMAFDFGEKRIGVATGQLITQTTQALTVLACKNDQPDWQAVEKIIHEWRIQGLVIGLPLNMLGEEQLMTTKSKKFANRLHGRFGLPIFFHDERLTSIEVKEYLFEIGGYKKIKDNEIDAFAAELILQGFFENQSTNSCSDPCSNKIES